jgi:acyl-coenzyme A thioesterase PaaI-like protein
VDDIVKSAFLNRPDLHIGTEGEFKGWRTWSRDNFESHNGPFWHRMDDDGQIRCAFRVEKKHLNGHAQCPWRRLHGVCGLLAAREGELVDCTGEIMRASGSMIFLRGLLKSAERPLFTFSGTIKRVKRRSPPVASTTPNKTPGFIAR